MSSRFMAFYTSKYTKQWNGGALIGMLVFCIGCFKNTGSLKRNNTYSATSTKIPSAKKQANGSTPTVLGTGSRPADAAVSNANAPKAGSSVGSGGGGTGRSSGDTGRSSGGPIGSGSPLSPASVQQFKKSELLDTLKNSELTGQTEMTEKFINDYEKNPVGDETLECIFEKNNRSYDRTLNVLVVMAAQEEKKKPENNELADEITSNPVSNPVELVVVVDNNESENSCSSCGKKLEYKESFDYQRIKVQLSCGCNRFYHNECLKKEVEKANSVHNTNSEDLLMECPLCKKEGSVLMLDGTVAPKLKYYNRTDFEFKDILKKMQERLKKAKEEATSGGELKKAICLKQQYLSWLDKYQLFTFKYKVYLLYWLACHDTKDEYLIPYIASEDQNEFLNITTALNLKIPKDLLNAT